MKKFKIFIASSLEDLESERSQLVIFANELNKKLRQCYSIEIEPVYCEAHDHQFSEKRMQDIFNQQLTDSDLAVFMFYHDAGPGTVEEFQVAKRGFSAKKSPLIYLFFKKLPQGESETECLASFKNELFNQEGHYAESFSHVDTVKLRIILCIQSLLKSLPQVSTENGYVKLDNIQLLSLENVSEFSNNTTLQQLHKELGQIEERYVQIKRLVETGAAPTLEAEYQTLKLQKEKISKSIFELQKSIFEMSLNMSHDALHGQISARQKEAYRVFEAGDYKGCLAILNEEDADQEFETAEAQLMLLQKQNAEKYISEQTMAIKILQLMVDDPSRFQKIDNRFKKVIPVARKYHVKPFVVYHYAAFLFSQRRFTEATQMLMRLKQYYLEGNGEATPLQLAKLHNLLGAMYFLMGNYPAAKDNYLQTQQAGLVIEKEKPDFTEIHSGLGRVNNNLGVLDWLLGDTESAEANFEDALRRFKIMAGIDQIYTTDVAGIMKNQAHLLACTSRFSEARELYEEAMDTFNECLTFDDKLIISAKIAEACCGLSALYQMKNNFDKAEKQLMKALNKLQSVVTVYPGYHDFDLAVIYSGLGCVCRKNGEADRSQEYFQKAAGLLEALKTEVPGVYDREYDCLMGLINTPGDASTQWSRSALLHKYIVTLYT